MKSLKTRFIFAFLLLVAVVYAMFYLGFQMFLEDFYFNRKIESMVDVEKKINMLANINSDEEERKEALDYLNYNFEGRISLFGAQGKTVLNSADISILTKATDVRERKIAGKRVFIITTNYPVSDTKSIVYSSLLPSGDILVVQSPISGVVNSVNLVKRFVNIVALISAATAMLISLLLSNNLTKPINELNNMAMSLRNLEFDKVYEIDREDEIGTLSVSLVELSDNLENTINSLKFELSKDKEINQIRRQFIATASHELRTPLTVIKSYTEALEDGIFTDESEKKMYYNTISEEVDKITAMVRELVQITLLESKEFKLDKKKFDIMDMFNQLATDYKFIASKKDIPFSPWIEEEQVYYYGDENRLEQAFRNILNNAFKFTNKETPVFLESYISDNTLVVTVENSGQKIPEEDLPQVFEIFYKGEQKGGSGIGLAVTANILSKHGIDYYIKNIEGGVRFTAKIKIV